MTTTLSPAAQAELTAIEAQSNRRVADPRCRTIWRVVANCLHYDGEGVGSKMLRPDERLAALQLCDGFGKTTDPELLFDWSHVRDSSDAALEAVARFLFGVFARQQTARDYARRMAADFPCVDRDTIRELAETAEIARAHSVARSMRRSLRHAAKYGTTNRRQLTKLAELGILFESGSVTRLGYRLRDGWLCERCGCWGDASETYYSAEHCNTTGRDVALCEPCCRKANAEHELAAMLQPGTVAP